ncbi:MAG: hypothetical protein IKU07_07270 [Oscillospiraceae bacterium]|nr:hypothetical protein [Oscillospiraceae bacterium]
MNEKRHRSPARDRCRFCSGGRAEIGQYVMCRQVFFVHLHEFAILTN